MSPLRNGVNSLQLHKGNEDDHQKWEWWMVVSMDYVLTLHESAEPVRKVSTKNCQIPHAKIRPSPSSPSLLRCSISCGEAIPDLAILPASHDPTLLSAKLQQKQATNWAILAVEMDRFHGCGGLPKEVPTHVSPKFQGMEQQNHRLQDAKNLPFVHAFQKDWPNQFHFVGCRIHTANALRIRGEEVDFSYRAEKLPRKQIGTSFIRHPTCTGKGLWISNKSNFL